MDIKIGEYIRTKTGELDKVDALYGMIENTVHLENQKWFDTRNILKHSPNIIDLIEVGDYVNGYRILEIHEALAPDDEKILDIGYGMAIFVEDIKSIVTKEMMKNVMYEI